MARRSYGRLYPGLRDTEIEYVAETVKKVVRSLS